MTSTASFKITASRASFLLVIAAALINVATAHAQSAASTSSSTVTATDPRAFLDDLAARAFALLRDRSVAEPQRRAAFRAMLRDNFALKEIGDRLIRRHRAEITPAQYAAFQQTFPGWIVGTYADRLEGFTDARFQTVRTAPRGTSGVTDVFARVTVRGKNPIDTVWAIKRTDSGRFQVLNITVSGINLALTQEEDFNAKIERQGFDSLIAFMRQNQAA